MPTDDKQLRAAVLAMAQELEGLNTDGTWETMTCPEVESIAEVLRVVDREDVATMIISCHAVGDRESYDAHHQIYLSIMRGEAQ